MAFISVLLLEWSFLFWVVSYWPQAPSLYDIVTEVLPSSSDKERIHTDNLLVLQYTHTFCIVYIIFSCKQQQEWLI